METVASCTYVAQGFDPVMLLTIRRDIYDQTLGRHYKTELEKKIKFFKQLPFCQKLPDSSVIILAASTQRERVKENTIVCEQDRACEKVFFVGTGLVTVIRKVAFLPSKFYFNKGLKEAKEVYRIDPLALDYKPAQ